MKLHNLLQQKSVDNANILAEKEGQVIALQQKNSDLEKRLADTVTNLNETSTNCTTLQTQSEQVVNNVRLEMHGTIKKYVHMIVAIIETLGQMKADVAANQSRCRSLHSQIRHFENLNGTSFIKGI